MTSRGHHHALQFLGLNRDTSILLVALLGMGFAEELWMRFLPKYLETLGATIWIIGSFDAIKTWVGAVYAYPGGVLTDRYGQRKALALFTSMSIAGYVFLWLSTRWITVLLSAFLFLSWSSFSLPTLFSLIGRSLASRQYAMGIGVQATVKRIPIILGPIAGGLLLDRYGVIHGVRIGVLIAMALGTLMLPVQLQIRDTMPLERRAVRKSFLDTCKNFDSSLRRLLLSDVLIRVCERIPYAWIVLYALDHIGITATEFGVLTSIEMAAAMLCLIPVGYLSDRYGREPFIIATFIFFTLFPVSLLFAHNMAWLILAFVIRGLKEFGETARKSLIIQLSPEEARGQTIGAYYLIRDVIATGAAFLGALLWRISPQANFLGAALVGLSGTLLYVWHGMQKRHTF